jgi:hypothetical protein
LLVELTTQEYIDLIKHPCFYCGDISTGLDRLDNLENYTFDNCVSCCTVCNRIKADIFNYEETFVIINSVQKLRIFYNGNSKEKICAICNTRESSSWYKHPEEKNSFLCSEHYKNVFNKIEVAEEIFEKYFNNVYNNRYKNFRKKLVKKSITFSKCKELLELENMVLLTTFLEYRLNGKHKPLTIQCQKGHIFKRDSSRIKLIGTCPDCEGVSNKGGAFKEKLAEKGWVYVSGEYVNKESILTVTCEHGRTETKKYRWLRDNTCNVCNSF